MYMYVYIFISVYLIERASEQVNHMASTYRVPDATCHQTSFIERAATKSP